MPIRLQLLGGLTAYHDDVELCWVPARRIRTAVLVYLAVERQATREQLAGLFWPDHDTESARHSVSQVLYLLRQAFGAEWLESGGEVVRVAGCVACDTECFERLVEQGEHDAAVRIYGGAFLRGQALCDTPAFEAWVDRNRAHYERLHRRARRAQIASLCAAGSGEAAAEAARAWVAREPYDDEAQHQLIDLLAAGGHRFDALQQYELYERMLQADDLQPLDETRALVAELRNGHAAVPAPPSGGNGAREAERLQAARPPPAGRVEAEQVPAPHTPPPRPRGRRTRAAGRAWRSDLRVAAGPSALTLFLLLLTGLALRYAGNETAAVEPRSARQPFALVVLPVELLLDADSARAIPPEGGTPASYAAHIARTLDFVLPRHLQQSRGVRIQLPELIQRSPGRERVLELRTVREDTDYLVKVTLSVTASGTRLTLQLLDRDHRVTGGAVSLAGAPPAVMDAAAIEHVARRGADQLLATLRLEARERRWRSATRSERAIELVYRSLENVEEARTAEDQLRHEDAIPHWQRADELLTLASEADPRWDEPLLRRARIAGMRAAFARSAGGTQEGAEALLAAALEEVDDVLERDPKNAQAFQVRGWLQFVRWRFLDLDSAEAEAVLAGAERDLENADLQDPGDARAALHLADVASAREDHAGARHWAREALSRDLFHEERTHYVLHRLAAAAFELGDEAEALRLSRDALVRFPDDPGAMHHGCILDVLAFGDGPVDADTARHHLEAILRTPGLKPHTHLYYRAAYAAALARAGDPEGARRALARVRADYPRAFEAGGDMQWLDAAVSFRIGDTVAAGRLLTGYAQRHPGASVLKRRHLRGYLQLTVPGSAAR